MATRSPDDVRRDLFSVKADVRDGAGWCHVYMTKNRSQARRRAKEIREDRTLGLNRLAKVVHPKQFVVIAYTACGNVIDDG
jgi:hypothetical protein